MSPRGASSHLLVCHLFMAAGMEAALERAGQPAAHHPTPPLYIDCSSLVTRRLTYFFPREFFLVTTTLEEQKCFHLRKTQVAMCLVWGGGGRYSCGQDLLTNHRELPVQFISNPVLGPPGQVWSGVSSPVVGLDPRGCFKNPCKLRDWDLWVSL